MISVNRGIQNLICMVWSCRSVYPILVAWGRVRRTRQKHQWKKWWGLYWGRVSFGWGKIRQSWWRGSEGIGVICLVLFEMKNWNWYELSPSTEGANLWYIYTIWCVELVKEQTESGCGKVWLGNVGGVQGVVWISYCSGCAIEVSLQRFIWSGWHSLSGLVGLSYVGSISWKGDENGMQKDMQILKRP